MKFMEILKFSAIAILANKVYTALSAKTPIKQIDGMLNSALASLTKMLPG